MEGRGGGIRGHQKKKFDPKIISVKKSPSVVVIPVLMFTLRWIIERWGCFGRGGEGHTVFDWF